MPTTPDRAPNYYRGAFALIIREDEDFLLFLIAVVEPEAPTSALPTANFDRTFVSENN
jgi:hypothetical protein